jgi:hypothetical protein
MKRLCGYCLAQPAMERGYCRLCQFNFKQAGIAITRIAPVEYHEAPPASEVNARLNTWLNKQLYYGDEPQ